MSWTREQIGMTLEQLKLKTLNDNPYVGSTTDLDRRLKEHQAGLGSNYTRKHRPVQLVHYEEYQSVAESFCREKQLHGWSRAKKEDLIRGECEKLPALSTSRKTISDNPIINKYKDVPEQ